MSLQILVLANAAAQGDAPPVLIAEQGGQVLVERLAAQLAPLEARVIFVVNEEDMRRWHLDKVIQLAIPGAIVLSCARPTAGAVCTAMLALHHIDLEDELLILAANERLEIAYPATLEDFRARGLDAATLVFSSLHPRYAYVALDDDGAIVEAAEKRPISRNATAGFYWYARAGDFLDAAQDMIRKDAQVDGAFYLSMIFNQLVLRQRRLGVRQIAARDYVPLKSARQINAYEGDFEERFW